MHGADLTEAVFETSQRLISASRTGDVDGEDRSACAWRTPDDTDVYYALQEAKRRGALKVV